jgi:repressor of nif and glnA expression
LPKATSNEIEGITLKVYLYIAKVGKPVGAREVTRGLDLSSPSVAYRHLEKLEDLGLLQKNEFGEYTVKRKANISGYSWVGRRLIAKMLVYSTVFMAILLVELAVFAVHFAVETYEFKVFFLLLILVTGLAMAVFMVEYLRQREREKQKTENGN